NQSSSYEFVREGRPGFTSFVVHRLQLAVLLPEGAIALPQPLRSRVRRLDAPMRIVEQHPLDLPDVRVRESPVVVAHLVRHVDDRVARDAAGEVDVWIRVSERERSWRLEHGPAAVQTRIPRASHRSPAPATLIDEDDVVEVIDRFETEHERRVA